ncbi:MAG TPA: hypothetical protein VJ624_08565 [Thermodesulfobacteriota bacterium]|nr:hypothetical protein [Thermodesulfobacteriota bacterium]
MNTINKITEKQVVMKQDQIGSKFNLKGGLKMKVCEKYAWVILLAVGLLWLVVGFVAVFQPEGIFEGDAQAVTNMPWSELKASSPIAANFIIFIYGQMGLLKISWTFFVLAITLTGYRKGEKWAWYFMWSVPALLVSDALFSSIFIGDISQMLQFIPITTITLLGLLLPYRKFFPK